MKWHGWTVQEMTRGRKTCTTEKKRTELTAAEKKSKTKPTGTNKLEKKRGRKKEMGGRQYCAGIRERKQTKRWKKRDMKK